MDFTNKTILSNIKNESVNISNDLLENIVSKIRDYVMAKLEDILKTNTFLITYERFKMLSLEAYKFDDRIQVLKESIEVIMKENNKEWKNHQLKIRFEVMKDGLSDVLTPDNTDELVYFEGNVCKISNLYPKIISLAMLCVNCKKRKSFSENIKFNFLRKNFCKCKTYENIVDDENVILQDIQEIRILIKEGEYINCTVYDDLTNSYLPGEEIRGIGILRLRIDKKGLYKLHMEINNIICMSKVKLKSHHFENENKIGKEYDKMLEHYGNRKDFFNMLTNSIFKDIIGNNNIKLGLLMALFGGSNSEKKGAINVLLMGDPGVGKSKMLLKVGEFAKKSIYVMGTNSTPAGLSVNITNNPGTGDLSIEAGALVLANNGVCLVDEFDKIQDYSAFYEVMEDGLINYTKGGIFYQMNVNTSVIAAANPKGGNFSKINDGYSKTYINRSLLNRFDLIFELKEKYDFNKIEKILQQKITYNSHEKDERENLKGVDHCKKTIDEFQEKFLKEKKCHIIKRNILNNVCFDPKNITDHFIVEYIQYCRQYFNPILSLNARIDIKEYFKTIRHHRSVNIRTLLSLIKLTQACAKSRMQGIASVKDAEVIINLHKETLKSEEKNLKKHKMIDFFTEKNGQNISKNDIENMLSLCKLHKNIDLYIDKLNQEGILIMVCKNIYKVNIS